MSGPEPRHDRVTPEELQAYDGLFRADEAYQPSQPQQTPPGPPPVADRKKRRWPRILLAIVAVILAYFISVVAVFGFAVTKVDAMPATQIAQTSGTNYLLVGSDGREELSTKEQNRLHVGSVDGNRTDTIMILHVPNFGQPTLVSIPRDSWVPIPGHGDDKINAAFALGGPSLLIETVEQNTGIHIDHYVEIGMVGIAQVTDALGGVTLCPDRKYNDEKSNLKVKKGCQEMDGPTALAYVRMRYQDPKGDLGRVERQQEYIAAVATETASPLTWLNPFKMYSVAAEAGESLTVSEGTGVLADARMGIAMGMIARGWGEATTVPTQEGGIFVGGQEALAWDEPAARELFAELGAE